MHRAALLALLVGSLGADAPLPRAAPLAPDAALASFQVQGGFRLERVAAEPLVMDPVAGAYDEDGRLYVVEMSDYPHVDAANDRPYAENTGDPPIGRVRLLIDRDGDGTFDESHLFAEKLSWPTGIAIWKGGVYVAATPDIWYLRDTDNDHRADVHRQVFTGFRKYNVQAVMNNLQWGLDHRIYGAGSSNGGKIRPADRPADPGVDILRRDFRFDPRTDQFEAISGGARFGNTFDDWGNRFLCDIRNPAQHVVLPAHYLARNPFLPIPRALNDAAEFGDAITLFRISPPEPWRAVRAERWAAVGKAIPRSELVAGGFLTSSSGLTCYRGDAYPTEYRGQLFLGEVANNLVHRMAVVPEGVTFRAVRADARAEFVASTDTWFRPVNFVPAPDGTLHVLDMYRETIEHPWSIPDDIRALLDLRSGEDKGRIYRLAPPGFHVRPGPRLGAATTAELVALLEHPDGWHRDTAHRLLFERQDSTAVGPLRQLVRAGKDPRGRLHALYSLDGLAALADDDVRQALRDAAPQVRAHAVRLAEARVDRFVPEIMRLASDADVRVRFQVAFTAGAIDGRPATPVLAEIAFQDAADPWVRTAILSSATAEPARLFVRLLHDAGFATSAGGAALLRSLAQVIGGRGGADDAMTVVHSLAGAKLEDETTTTELLTALGDARARSGRQRTDLRSTIPESTSTSVWLDRQFARATSLAADGAAPADRRARAALLVGQGDFAAAEKALPPLLDPQQPPEVQAAAARALAGFDRPEVAGILLRPWKSYTPTLRTEVVGYLLSRHAWIAALLDAIDAGIVPAGQVPATRRALLFKDRDPAVRARAQALFGDDAPGPRAEAIARYKPALDHAGDADRGRSVFERECLACHTLGTLGHAVGPNLAGVRRRTAEEILVNILDPNREASPEFHEYTLALDDGRVLTGLVTSETPTSVTLRGREAVEQTILRRNVAEIVSTGKSLMPEGLEKTINPPEMADLITFLLKLQD
jgi:putative membrane-bound dehydrogenase-like protein